MLTEAVEVDALMAGRNPRTMGKSASHSDSSASDTNDDDDEEEDGEDES